MSSLEFVVGQRWVSNSEAELGLGLIKEVAGRRVVVLFPAIGEQRTYATDQAPLSRVVYNVGDEVSTNDDAQFTVSQVHELSGCYIYQGEDEAGEEYSIHEVDLSSEVQFSLPQDRLFAGQVDKNSQFDLRLNSLSHQHRLQQSSVFGLMGARASLLPHQFYIADRVSQRIAPRVLLADEVGLGKTIEAGLILHQQIITERVQRALIVVPDSLLHQWLVEMLRRFNLQFTLLDAERIHDLLESDPEANPFESSQLVLCGLSTLTNDEAVFDYANTAHWDLMIVDEAHHLHWSESEVSHEYEVIAKLSQQIEGLLLLTATPEQLGVESHFARLKLLDPERYFDLQTFINEQENYRPISDLVAALSAENAQQTLKTDSNLAESLNKYLDAETLNKLTTSDDFNVERQQAIDELLDHHGTGRILFRNTRDVVEGFPERKLHLHSLSSPETYTAASFDTLPQRLQSEWVLGEDWVNEDPRVAWLVDWLKQNRQQKVLLICANAETAQELEVCLRVRQGVRSSVFHEGLSLINRDRAAAYFADDEDGAQILICSEIGSEGRNFQFAHHLVLFDLPLNPDLLEQRIGRLDRIGQTETVNIHVPYYENTAQHSLLRWYHEGMNAFERVFPAGMSVFAQCEAALVPALENNTGIDDLINQTQQITEQVLAQLQQGRDRLLELNSFNPENAVDTISEIEHASQARELANYMDAVFDEFGVEQQVHSADSIIVEPGTHMSVHHFPALPEDGLTATYQRHKALVREDMVFLTWEHPMVLGAMDLVLHGDFGNTAFCTLPTDKLPEGTLLLEGVFKLHCMAPKYLQVGRYFDDSYIRVVVDQKANDYSELFSEIELSELAGRIPRTTAQQMIRHARPNIETLVSKANKQIEALQKPILKRAIDNMSAQMDAEHQRLDKLTKINPNIRPIELEYFVESKQILTSYLSDAKFVLDAIRVAIVTEPS